MGIRIRRATQGDLDEIMLHRTGMFRDMGFTDASELAAMEATSRRFIERALQDGSYLGWLAEENGKVAAGAGLIVHSWPSHPVAPHQTQRAYILNVYTHPQYRRRSFARRLMEEVLTWCKANGFKTIWLHASEFGRPLYDSMGFTPTNEMKLVFD